MVGGLVGAEQAVAGAALDEVVLAARGVAVRDGVAPHALRHAHQEAARRTRRQRALRLAARDHTMKPVDRLVVLVEANAPLQFLRPEPLQNRFPARWFAR